MKTYIKGEYKLFREIVFSRLGFQNDFVGYESLIEHIEKHKIHDLDGDFLEIGAFMGGGSAKLAKYANIYSKKLFVIDLFDPDFDLAQNDRGESMNFIYRKILGPRNLREIFNKNTRNEKNIIVYSGDSKEITLPVDTKLCFSFIDGNHNPEYTKSDFHLAWGKTVSGGIVAFHDYGGDLPQVTDAIKELIEEHKGDISNTYLISEKTIMFVHKK